MVRWTTTALEKAMAQEDEYINRLKELIARTPEGRGRRGTVLSDKAERDLRLAFRTEYVIAIRCGMAVADIRALADVSADDLRALIRAQCRRQRDQRRQAASVTQNQPH